MGIEDFNLDLQENEDRVLVVSGSPSTVDKLSALLEKRNYRCRVASNLREANLLASRELFDMIVFECDDATVSPEATLEQIRQRSALGSSLVLILHAKPELFSPSVQFGPTADAELIKLPFVPSDVLVKISTQLRRRKIKAEQSNLREQISTENSQLRDLNNRFKRELVEAKELQESLLPTDLPQDDSCLMTASYIPLEAVGGDLYDIWKIDTGVYGIFLGDASGHGLPAAFIGAMSKMALAYASKDSPDIMLGQMNAGLVEHMPEGRFITVAAAIYESSSGRLRIACAGAPPPIILRNASATVDTVRVRGLPLGVIPVSHYEVFETILEPGDKLLMVTDGIVESANLSGELLGDNGLAEAFRAGAKDGNIEDSIRFVLDKQREFCDGRIIKDDCTLVGLERIT